MAKAVNFRVTERAFEMSMLTIGVFYNSFAGVHRLIAIVGKYLPKKLKILRRI